MGVQRLSILLIKISAVLLLYVDILTSLVFPSLQRHVVCNYILNLKKNQKYDAKIFLCDVEVQLKHRRHIRIKGITCNLIIKLSSCSRAFDLQHLLRQVLSFKPMWSLKCLEK